MARFSKLNSLFALKLNVNDRSILERNVKIWLFQKVEKSHNKVGVGEEIGCNNEQN